MGANKIAVEVAYATPHQQVIIKVEVAVGATMQEVIMQSGILTQFPEIDLSKQKIGVFSKQKRLDEIVKAGERIEIYRPLTIDPKEARRAKAKLTAKLKR